MNNENELTAALVTIEKCREITNCPAGVDLQDHLRQLATENVGLKSFGGTLHEIKSSLVGGGHGHMAKADMQAQSAVMDVIFDAFDAIETPATDRIVAAQRSAFVDEAVAKITDSGALTFGDCIVALCQLREGAK